MHVRVWSKVCVLTPTMAPADIGCTAAAASPMIGADTILDRLAELGWLNWVGWLQIMCQNVWMALVAHTPQTVRIIVLASPTLPTPLGGRGICYCCSTSIAKR
jgi:hypothetical protein